MAGSSYNAHAAVDEDPQVTVCASVSQRANGERPIRTPLSDAMREKLVGGIGEANLQETLSYRGTGARSDQGGARLQTLQLPWAVRGESGVGPHLPGPQPAQAPQGRDASVPRLSRGRIPPLSRRGAESGLAWRERAPSARCCESEGLRYVPPSSTARAHADLPTGS